MREDRAARIVRNAARLGVPEADLPAMAEEAHAIRRLLDNNPREIGREQILAIYRAAH